MNKITRYSLLATLVLSPMMVQATLIGDQVQVSSGYPYDVGGNAIVTDPGVEFSAAQTSIYAGWAMDFGSTGMQMTLTNNGTANTGIYYSIFSITDLDWLDAGNNPTSAVLSSIDVALNGTALDLKLFDGDNNIQYWLNDNHAQANGPVLGVIFGDDWVNLMFGNGPYKFSDPSVTLDFSFNFTQDTGSEVGGGSTSVPEPGIFSLLGLGLVAMFLGNRRRRML